MSEQFCGYGLGTKQRFYVALVQRAIFLRDTVLGLGNACAYSSNIEQNQILPRAKIRLQWNCISDKNKHGCYIQMRPGYRARKF